jgi:hypothetical protein
MSVSEFIAEFFSASTGSIYLCSLPNERDGGRPAEICGRGDGTRLDELVHQAWDRNDRGTFFCVNTVRPGQSRRSKETVHEIVALHADIDLDKVDASRDEIERKLGQLLLLPTYVIASGHGFHAYWLLHEAIEATPKAIAHTEHLLHRVADHVGGDPAVCEIARLMRLPGSRNTKNGGSITVGIIAARPNRYDLDDLQDWLDHVGPFIARKARSPEPDNAFLAADVPTAGAPVDVEARLAAMCHRGTGDTSIHQTQISVSAAMLSRGRDVDETVAAVLAATRAAAGEEGARWDWQREEKDIRRMCASWQRKKLNGSQSPPPRRHSMADLSTMEFKPTTFLIPDLIPAEGVCLICSKPKVGKSWLLYDLCISATVDRDMLGSCRPAQGHALYLALEDGLRRLKSRGEKLLPIWQAPWPTTLTLATEWGRVDQGGIDEIRSWVLGVRASGAPVACIAVDVLKMIRPAGQDRKSAYDRDYEALVGLRALAHELGVAIVVAHHTRKAEADDLIDKVSGTHGLSGAADTIMVIERATGGGFLFDIRGARRRSRATCCRLRQGKSPVVSPGRRCRNPGLQRQPRHIGGAGRGRYPDAHRDRRRGRHQPSLDQHLPVSHGQGRRDRQGRAGALPQTNNSLIMARRASSRLTFRGSPRLSRRDWPSKRYWITKRRVLPRSRSPKPGSSSSQKT